MPSARDPKDVQGIANIHLARHLERVDVLLDDIAHTIRENGSDHVLVDDALQELESAETLLRDVRSTLSTALGHNQLHSDELLGGADLDRVLDEKATERAGARTPCTE